MNTKLIKKAAVVAIGLSLIGGIALAPASMAAAPNRYITISAEGSVKVTPDAVRINANVTTVGKTSKEALAANADAAAAVRATIKENGVATKDISTSSVTIYPEYTYTEATGQVLVGYRASQGFAIIIHKTSTAGDVVDAIVAAGGDSVQLSGVTPFVLDSSKAVLAARTLAVKHAQSKARSYAALAHIKLGKVVYLMENSSPSPYPIAYNSAAGTKADSAPTVVDLGQQDVTVSISMKWSLA
ncbi:MAG: SIMPL domain-containing protein [Actinomycetota bacterium]